MNPVMTMLLRELRQERAAAAQHFESLDTKAGIVLGFSGFVAAFPTGDRAMLFMLGRGFAVLSALVALAALLPRRFPILRGDPLRQALSEAIPDVAAGRLVACLLRAEGPALRVLRSKAQLLLIAGSGLTVAIVFISVETIFG